MSVIKVKGTTRKQLVGSDGKTVAADFAGGVLLDGSDGSPFASRQWVADNGSAPDLSGLAEREPADGSYRIKTTESGTFLQFWNETTGKYHTLFPDGPEGAVTTNWGPGED